jgi:DNA-binding MarR family transcriptional regulator
MGGLTTADYAHLLEFRTALRRFEGWSQRQAERAGLTPAQHQLLLVVKGHGEDRGPTVRQIADYLTVRPHSAVGLIDRAESAGLVRRARDVDDARVVRVRLTEGGESRIAQLSELHLVELSRLAPLLRELSPRLVPADT